MTEYSDQDGANKLAGRLRAYWKAQGHDIETRVEPVAVSPAVATKLQSVTLWQVRSNLINGHPA